MALSLGRRLKVWKTKPIFSFLIFGITEALSYTIIILGGSYSIGRTRLSANYGRQRGGLICVGGVCRYVPESNGYNLSLSYSF